MYQLPTLAVLLVGASILLPGVRARATAIRRSPKPTGGHAEGRVPLNGSSRRHPLPLDIGIEGALEVPYGFTAHLGLGFMPRLYRDAINETAVGFGWYDDTDAAVVAAALEDAFLLSPTLGWRPPGLRALELYLGYTVAFAGGTVTRAEAEAVAGEDLPGGGAVRGPRRHRHASNRVATTTPCATTWPCPEPGLFQIVASAQIASRARRGTAGVYRSRPCSTLLRDR